MIEIKVTATFPRDKNAGYFIHLLDESGISNASRLGRMVTATFDGHGTREEVRGMVERCFGTVVDEKFWGDD